MGFVIYIPSSGRKGQGQHCLRENSGTSVPEEICMDLFCPLPFFSATLFAEEGFSAALWILSRPGIKQKNSFLPLSHSPSIRSLKASTGLNQGLFQGPQGSPHPAHGSGLHSNPLEPSASALERSQPYHSRALASCGLCQAMSTCRLMSHPCSQGRCLGMGLPCHCTLRSPCLPQPRKLPAPPPPSALTPCAHEKA